LNLAQGVEPSDFEGIDAIFHLAALPHVDYSRFHPEQTVTNNVQSLLAVAKLATSLEVPMVFSSSVETYGGNVDKLYRETDCPNPLSPYAASKVACEAIINSYVDTQDLQATTFRFTNLYGPLQAPDRLMPRVIAQILRGHDVVVERGTNRDFVFVGDACEVLESAIGLEHKGEIYNLSSGNRIDNFDAVQSVARLLPDVDLQVIPPRPRDGRGILSCEPGKAISPNWLESSH